MVPFCLHAVANTPAGRMEFVRSYDSLRFGLPHNRGGSAPALVFSRPAQRSLTLRPACSPSRHSDPLHQRLQQSRCLHCCSDCYRVERTSSRAGLPPLWTTAFSRRTRFADYTSKCPRALACSLQGRLALRNFLLRSRKHEACPSSYLFASGGRSTRLGDTPRTKGAAEKETRSCLPVGPALIYAGSQAWNDSKGSRGLSSSEKCRFWPELLCRRHTTSPKAFIG